ncbi:hypothetical protein R6Q59_003171 [Mikania micrantha]
MGSRSEDIDDTSTPESLLLTAADSFRHTSSPATAVLIISTLVAVSGSFIFGSAVGFSSPAQTEIMNDLGLSLEEYSVFGSILTIGAMVGAVMSGKIADRLGRRTVSWLLDVGRLSIGYGIGVLSYVVPVYIAEITPQNFRGAFTTVNQLMICIGVSIMWLIGIFIPWRTLAIIGTIPCLLQLMGLFFIPESPRWLAKLGLWKDCESALHRLRGKDAEIFEEAAEIRDYTETLNQLSEARVFDLLQPEYAKSLIVGVGLMVLQQFEGVNAIAFYVDSIFISAGFSSSIGSIAMVIVQVPFTLLGVLLMDISGRRPLLMVSAAGTCVGCFLTGISFLLQDLQVNNQFSPIFALVGVLIFSGSFSLGMGGIPWVIMSEGSAGSLVTVVNWFGSWVVSYAFNFLMKCSTEGSFSLSLSHTHRVVWGCGLQWLEHITHHASCVISSRNVPTNFIFSDKKLWRESHSGKTPFSGRNSGENPTPETSPSKFIKAMSPRSSYKAPAGMTVSYLRVAPAGFAWNYPYTVQFACNYPHAQYLLDSHPF